MKSMNIIGVGVDVSKEKIDVVFRQHNEKENHHQYKNTKQGLDSLTKDLQGYDQKIVMESTGRYHLLSAIMLKEAGFDVRVVNPLLPRKYLVARIRKNKTDKADASVLAEMAEVEKRLPQSFKATRDDLKARQKIGLVCALEEQLQALKAIAVNFEEAQDNLSLSFTKLEQSLKETVKELEKTKRGLEKEIGELLRKKTQNTKKQEILITIPGISEFLANLIIHFLDEVDYPNKKQWIGFVGLDISQKQSGKWQGHGRLSKRGNAYLRKRLFSGAWGATMHNQMFKEYYIRLKNSGRRHKEALVIIARKLLTICLGTLKSQKPFSAALCKLP